MWNLLRESNNNFISMIASFIYISANIFCYGMSALYHVGRWSIQTEILLQKLDHCGIAILSVGTFIPTSLLLLSPIVSVSFLVTLIYNNDYGNGYTRLEWIGFFTVTFFKVSSLIVFVNGWPNPFPKIFGYHEIFHILVVFAGITIYLVNWSIIRRISNPYHHDTEIIKAIMKNIYIHD